MERAAFLEFVDRALVESIVVAENVVGVRLPREFCFLWLGKDMPIVSEHVAEYVAERVYVDAEHIFPCVDLGVCDVLEDGRALILAHRAGYAACEFKKNWTGRDGPFVYVVWSRLMQRVAGENPPGDIGKGTVGFEIPEMGGGVREWKSLERGEVFRPPPRTLWGRMRRVWFGACGRG